MRLTPDEAKELLSQDGYVRHVTDVLVCVLEDLAAPNDAVVLIIDSKLWGHELELGRFAASMTQAAAQHLYDQLGHVLIDLQGGT